MIRIEDLWKSFGRHDALRGISMHVAEGSAYALIGANGAGKTTTMKILMNILEPTRGHATVLGVDSRRISPRELGQIGYVSENQELPERLTVDEYFAYLRPLYARWDRDLEASLRGQLRLPAGRKIGALSHGMRMKMALACALPFRPPLLVLDEPFSGLDPLVRDEFMDGILSQAGETTILISTHELGEIEGVATHVAFIEEGYMIFDEPMDELRARFRAVRITFETPARLPSALPDHWLQTRTDGSVLEFIDARFKEGDSQQRLQSQFHGIRRIDVEPVGLRAVFTSLARAVRNQAA